MPICELQRLFYLEIIQLLFLSFSLSFPMLPYFFMAELTSESYKLKNKAAYFPCDIRSTNLSLSELDATFMRFGAVDADLVIQAT